MRQMMLSGYDQLRAQSPVWVRHGLEIGLLIAFWALCEAGMRALNLPIPGSVAGLLILWALLGTRLLPADYIRGGATRLLDHLILFFVPAMLALVNHPELISLTGLKLLAAVLLGLPVVMCGTALVVELGFRWSASRRH